MKSISRFLAGLLLGGVLGSVLAMLLAPLSGDQMRTKIKDNVYYVKNEVQSAAKTRSEELKNELAKLQKQV